MPRQPVPDFHHVDDEQRDIHDRLLNWARWVTPRASSTVSPMFRQYRSHAWQWHTPDHRPTCDTLDALLIEKSMRHLYSKHRQALLWAYINRCSPAIAVREIGVTYMGLAQMLREARFSVRNIVRQRSGKV